MGTFEIFKCTETSSHGPGYISYFSLDSHKVIVPNTWSIHPYYLAQYKFVGDTYKYQSHTDASITEVERKTIAMLSEKI